MKHILTIIILLILFTLNVSSQDLIVLKNGYKIKAQVLYKKDNTIFYKKYNSSSGKIKSVLYNEIKTIYFKKGREKLLSKRSQIEPKKTNDKVVVKTPDKVSNEFKNIEDSTKVKTEDIKNPELNYKINRPKKSFGLGVDIFLQDNDNSNASIGIDYYLSNYINIGLGYGYFYKKPTLYLSGEIIFFKEMKKWNPTIGIQYSPIEQKTVQELISNISKTNSSYVSILPSIGYQYLDSKGLSFHLQFGPSLIINSNSTNFNQFSLFFRVAGHL